MTKTYEIPDGKTIIADVDEKHHTATVSVYALDDLVEAVNKTAIDKWIPVSERLPEDNKTVIASVEYGVYPEAKYTKEYGWEWAYEAGAEYWVKLEKVKAWMPLPKPYDPQERSEE